MVRVRYDFSTRSVTKVLLKSYYNLYQMLSEVLMESYLSLNLLGLFIMLSVIGVSNRSKQDLEQFRKQFLRKRAK